METYKLISFNEGRFSLNEKVLEELLIPFKNRTVTTRLSILSFTGPPQSGKSFYTNLLAHYFDSKSFEWLTELSNQKGTDTKPLQGFQFGAVTGTEYVVSDTSESGIYVWPKLFNIKTYNGNLAVCILHQHQSPTDRAEQPNIHLKFNYLLHTISSRIIEIRQQEDKFPEYAPDNLKNTDVFRLELVYKIEADNVTTDKLNLQHYSKNGTYIAKSKQSLHTDSGHLMLTEDLHSQIDKAIQFIAETNSIRPKHDLANVPITLYKMKKHFQQCVDFINSCIQDNRVQTNSDHFHGNDNTASQNGDAELIGGFQQLDGYQQRGENDYEARSQKADEDAEKAAEMARITEAKEKARIAEAQAKRAKEEAEKAKENARKAEEEKIQSFVNDACTQVEPCIVRYLENWLNGHSILSSIDYFEGIYRCSIDEVLSPKLLGMLKMHRVRIRMLLESRSNSMKTDLEKIHEIITGFHSLVYNHMKTHICFPEEQILNELRKFIPVKKLNGTIIKYAEFGCKKLESLYASQNELIVVSECGLSSFCKDNIFKAYNEQMTQSLAISPCHPTRLTQTYQTFLKFVHAQLEPIKEFQGYLVSETSFLHVMKWKELETNLKQIYIKRRQSNAQKLKQLYNLVKPTVLRYKGEYCNEIEKILKESPNGIPKETLFMQNVAVRDTVKAKLCQEIRSIIGDNEPTEGYLKSLSCEIESVWLAFEDLNNQRLNTYSKKIKAAPIPSERKSLPPILFQLSLSRIGTCIYNESEFVNFGCSSTTVGETCDGILVCENLDSSQIEIPKFERSWKLSDLLFPEQKNTDEIVVEGSSHKIQTELILGLLLNSLKQKVEARQNGDATACVISVPFWLTSQQRQQVKDSGRVAGFQDTYIINENSAIALCISTYGTNEEQNDVVVLSESSDRVDSTIYSYEKLYNCIKTTGHCGVYETSIHSHSNAAITHKIKESYKVAQKTNDEKLGFWGKIKPKTVAIHYESEKYKDILTNVGKEIATTTKIWEEGEIMIVRGVHLFSQQYSRTKTITLQDWLSANIYRKIGEKKEEQIQEKKNFNLHSDVRNISNSFYLTNDVAYFFQKDVNGQKRVCAGIQLYSPSSDKKKIEVNLEISSESIINISLIHTGDVVLSQRKLDATKIAVYTSLLSSLQKLKVEIEKKNKRKQELIQQGSILLKRASTGQFKSALAQEMALQQIREALNLLNHPKITASDTEKQTELFNRYEEKFALQG